MPLEPSPKQTVTFLKNRLEEVGLRLRTQYGQNFLIDLNLLDVLVDAAQLTPQDVVLEVGTGMGSLTQRMAPRVAAVVTVEIDRAMHQLASEELIDCPNVTLINADALRGKNRLNAAVLEAVESHLGEGRHWKLVANLPYAIATPLLSNLLALDRPPESMTVTIQKEVGDRFIARPGTKDYGALSVWVQSQCRAEILRVLPQQVFWPRPKVQSAFVQITFDPQLRARIADRAFFHEFVRAMFFHRRKFVRAELLSVVKGQLDKAAVDGLLAGVGIDPTSRAETLDVETFLRLATAVRAATG